MFNYRKDFKKAMLLSIFPGMGFIYLQQPLLAVVFLALTISGFVMIGQLGIVGPLISLVAYGLSFVLIKEKISETYEHNFKPTKDPFFSLALSIIWDGLGQWHNGEKRKALFFIIGSLNTCILLTIFVCIFVGGPTELIYSKDSNTVLIANLLFSWCIFSLPIKALNLVDSFFTAFHLYGKK